MLLGALAQNIPDIDIVASFWLPATADLLAHRGITHSFLFNLVCAPLIAGIAIFMSKGRGLTFRRWTLFWGLQIFIHILIDAFNVYGTGWFEPFSHYRISYNTLFVADPLFFIWPCIAAMLLLLIKRASRVRMIIAGIALALSSTYLIGSVAIKLFMNGRVKQSMQSQHLDATRYFITPTPLNDLLWYIVIENDSGYHIGYSSIFDRSDKIIYHFARRNDTLLQLTSYEIDKERLILFSQGYYTAELRNDSLIFNDLRFGEQLGWENPGARFVFFYYLQYPDNNKMIVQRGRFAGWNKAAIIRFLTRIRGN